MSQFTRSYASDELGAVFGDRFSDLTGAEQARVITHVVELAHDQEISVMGAVELFRVALDGRDLADFANELA